MINHQEHEKVSDFSAGSDPSHPFKAHWTAFYADCKHEVLELTQGHRLALVYNLTYTSDAKPAALPTAEIPSQLTELIDEWTEEGAYGIGLSLEHEYSDVTLKDEEEDNWKGKDKDMIKMVKDLAAAKKVLAFVGRASVDMRGTDRSIYYSTVAWDFAGQWLSRQHEDVEKMIEGNMQVEEQMKCSYAEERITGNEGKLSSRNNSRIGWNLPPYLAQGPGPTAVTKART